jgi:hypothetical protein
MRRLKAWRVLAASTMLAVVMPPAPAVAAAAWSCPERNVCFWTGVNGTGSRCAWSVQDPDWTSGTMVCSWATRQNVKSIWNRGQSDSFTGVAYYLAKNYERRVGCTRQDARGNLTGTYKVLSHRWVTSTCG